MNYLRDELGVGQPAIGRRARRGRSRTISGLASVSAIGFIVSMAAPVVYAADATWTGTISGDWNQTGNWAEGVVPDGVATFSSTGASTVTFPEFSVVNGEVVPTSVGTIQFDAAAQAYTFNIGVSNSAIVQLTGAGIVNNSANKQTFINGLGWDFLNASSAGDAVIDNRGGLDMHDASTAGSATIKNSASMSFLGLSTAGNAVISNVGSLIPGGGNGLLRFDESSTAGAATITNTSQGILEFLDVANAGSATIVNYGAMSFSDPFNDWLFGAASAVSATITNSGNLEFAHLATADNAVIINTAGGQIFFSNLSTAANATIINDGTITFRGPVTDMLGSIIVGDPRDGTSAGNASITNNGLLLFTEASTGGNAAVTNGTTGIVDFSSSHGPAGGSGPSIGSIAGSGDIYLGGRMLTLGGNDLSTAFGGVISNCGGGADCATPPGLSDGRLTKVGTGTLTLTGTNSYSGITVVSGGALAVNGSIASSEAVVVESGGTLGGAGTVSAAIVNSGGTLAAGDAGPGTLTVAGSLTLNSGSTYAIDLSPADADRTSVAGIATLAGDIRARFAPGTYLPRSYVIMSASGGFDGSSFDTLSLVDAPGLRASLAYGATDVSIDLASAIAQIDGLNRNQRSVATVIDTVFNDGGGIGSSFPALFGLPVGALVDALTQLSGEAATGAIQTSFHAMNSFFGVMLDPSMGQRGGAAGGTLSFAPEAPLPAIVSAYAEEGSSAPVSSLAPAQRQYAIWGSAYGGRTAADGDGVTGSSTARDIARGFATGIDYRISPDMLAGFALSAGTTSWSLENGLGGGDSNMLQSGVYGMTRFGAAYLSGALAYAWHDASTVRTVTIAGTDRLAADFDVNMLGARIEGGYRFDTPSLAITPYAALQTETVHTSSHGEYAQSGSAQFALDYASQTKTSTRTELGANADRVFALGSDVSLLLQGRAAWAHDFDTERSIFADFRALPGSGFSIDGARQAHDSALLSVGVEARFAGGLSLGGRFGGELSSAGNAHSEMLTLRQEW